MYLGFAYWDWKLLDTWILGENRLCIEKECVASCAKQFSDSCLKKEKKTVIRSPTDTPTPFPAFLPLRSTSQRNPLHEPLIPTTVTNRTPFISSTGPNAPESLNYPIYPEFPTPSSPPLQTRVSCYSVPKLIIKVKRILVGERPRPGWGIRG